MQTSRGKIEYKYRVVTPEQFQQGYKEFRINEIPNVIEHQFKLIRKLPSGNYQVRLGELYLGAYKDMHEAIAVYDSHRKEIWGT